MLNAGPQRLLNREGKKLVFERVEGTSAGAKQAMARRRVSCLMSQSRITAMSN